VNTQAIPGALTRYRVMAWVVGTFLVLMTAWMVLGYGLWDYAVAKPTVYSRLWMVHGILYPLYLLAAVDLCFRLRYSVVRTLVVLLAGTIPFASFVAEHYVTRDVRARLATGPGPESEAAGQPDSPVAGNPPR
jgi:integral membrane protein